MIVPILTEAFKARPKAEWAAILDEHDIPAAPVNDVGDVFTHPHVLERDMVHTYDHPTLGPIKYPPSPVKFSGWAMPADPAPMLGEHSRAVLEDRLGMEPSVVARLIADGTIGTWVSDE